MAHTARTEPHAGLVGPNAVTQLLTALSPSGSAPALFAAAGAADWVAHPPSAMVDEHRVARLHRTVRIAAGETVMTEAGRLTANYLLAHRIPKPVQALLKVLPRRLAARILVSAIRAHAWTFAGSGRFVARVERTVIFEITGNPFCVGADATAPVCAWHGAVFQRLFQVLVSPNALVAETECEARGDGVCRFVMTF